MEIRVEVSRKMVNIEPKTRFSTKYEGQRTAFGTDLASYLFGF